MPKTKFHPVWVLKGTRRRVNVAGAERDMTQDAVINMALDALEEAEIMSSYREETEEITDRVQQVNYLRELGCNIAQNLGEGAAEELVEYALSTEGRESWGIEIPFEMDESDRELLTRFVGESL